MYNCKKENMASNKINKNIKTFDVNEHIGIADNARTEQSISWYRTAMENLITADILLKNKRISHCVFFMQQCIECIIKGILLENKLVDNVKDFNHSPENAIEQFYEYVESNLIDSCNDIKDKMRNISDFELRLEYMAEISNNCTIEHVKSSQDCPPDFIVNPNVLDMIGIDISSSKEKIYKHIQESMYVDKLIYCFAILFNGVQQNTRYPICENGISLPNEKYKYSSKIVNGLSSIIRCFNFIIGKILK